MKIYFSLLFFVSLVCTKTFASENAENEVELQSLVADKTKSSKKDDDNDKRNVNRSAFYSGFSLGLKNSGLRGAISSTDTSKLKTDKTSEIKVDKDHLTLDLHAGYDWNVFKAIDIGINTSVTFTPGTVIEYGKTGDLNVADVKVGNEYNVFAKFGFNFGRVFVYGKFGGSLLHSKYEWKIENAPKLESDYNGALAYGGGFGIKITDNVFVTFDITKNNERDMNALNITDQKNKKTVENSTFKSLRVTTGINYRF